MAEANGRSGGAQGHPAGASVGLTLMVLIIVSAVSALRNGFASAAPAYLTAQGWGPREIAQLFAGTSSAFSVVMIVLALVATYVGARSNMGWFAFIMSPAGRASRRQYWLSCWLPLTLAVLLVLPPVAIAIFLGTAFAFGTAEAAAGLTLAQLVPLAITIDLLLFWPSFAAAVKRLHDRGKSGWFLLVGLMPLIGQIWLLVEIAFLPGQKGANRYGPDPLAPATPID